MKTKTMEIPKQAVVICQDGECGHVSSIIIDPLQNKATHMVVAEEVIPEIERIVPIELVQETTPDSVFLSCTKSEFIHMEDFIEHHFLPLDKSYGIFPVKQIYYIPFSSKSGKFADITRKRIPPGEIDFPLGSLEVRARDGKVGKVVDLLIDEETDRITHFVISDGHLWTRKEFAVPAAKVEKIEKDVINLRLKKDELEVLPRLATLV